ncbi:lebercilin-like [Ambystoma mexicanum]|uniref:lebercilin-like n=1 Tax=Ambystoma mexicanum TaxID=8296 RepID=UPI0037E8E706
MAEKRRTQAQEPVCCKHYDKVDCRYYYYSDDFDSSSQTSAPTTPNFRSQSADFKRTSLKQQRSTNRDKQAYGRCSPQFPSNRRNACQQSSYQSFRQRPPPKSSNLSGSKSLSAKLLSMSALRSKLNELQAKLEDLQKENHLLQKLQIRQEKTLNKFEDTKNKIAALISRHNYEMRKLKEYLQSCKEQGNVIVRRGKTTKEDFYKTDGSLYKRNARAVAKHLTGLESLEQKHVLAENILNVRERKMKGLDKNIVLNQSNLQQQLISDDTHEMNKENKALQQKLHQLNKKLKKKEKELAARNINSNHVTEPPLERMTDLLFGKRKEVQTAPNPVSTKCIQTEEDILPVELISSSSCGPSESAAQIQDQKDEDNLKDLRKVDEELCITDKEFQEIDKWIEHTQNSEQKMQVWEETAQRLYSEWEREETLRMEQEKDIAHVEKEVAALNPANCKSEYENQNFEDIQDKMWIKNFLIEKIFATDPQNQNSFYSGSQDKYSNESSKVFSKHQKNSKRQYENSGLTFGCYSPSFARDPQRTRVSYQRGFVSEDNSMNTIDCTIKRVNSPTLLEQLFGVPTNTPSSSRGNSLKPLCALEGSSAKHISSGSLPTGKGSKNTITTNHNFSSERRFVNSSRPTVQHATSGDSN